MVLIHKTGQPRTREVELRETRQIYSNKECRMCITIQNSEVPFYSKHNSDVNYFHYITITVPSQYYDEDAILLDGDDPIHSNATTTVQSPLCGNFTLVSLEVWRSILLV